MSGRFLQIVTLLIGVSLAGCAGGPKPAEPTSPMDTAQSAVSKGMTNLERGNYLVAEKAFDRALALEPGYVPAYAGLVELALATDRFDDGWRALDDARSGDLGDDQLRRMATLEVRLLADEQAEDWYDAVQDVVRTAKWEVPGGKTHPPLLHAAAQAALHAFRQSRELDRLEDARDYAERLTALDDPLSADGQEILATVDQIRRAQVQPDPSVANLASKRALTRRDVAVLLQRILNLPKYLDGVRFQQASAPETNYDGMSDYGHLAAAEAIREAHRAPLRGMEIRDGRFFPARPVTRERFAVVVQDLIRTRQGDGELATRHVGDESPFPDVSSTRVTFSAIMTAVSRDLMAAREDGAFEPTDEISGSAAIEALRQLRRLKAGAA